MEKRFVVLIGSLGVVALSLGVGLVLVARGQSTMVTLASLEFRPSGSSFSVQ